MVPIVTVKLNNKVRKRLTRMLELHVSSCQDIDSHVQELRDLVGEAACKKGMRRLGKVFKALGDQKRLSILMLLNHREMCVCEVMAALDMTQPTASHHLSILEEAGLIRDRREGRWIFYSLSDPSVISLIEGADRIPSSLA